MKRVPARTQRRWCALLALAALAAGACWPPGVPPGPVPLRSVAGGYDAHDLLRVPVTAAQAAGAGELLTLGAMVAAEGDQIGGFIEVAAADCVLVMARPSSSVEDVDLFLFSDAGDLVAADEGPESAAAVVRCPPHPARIYAAARIVAGTGVVALGAMPLSPNVAEPVARAVGARGQSADATGRLASWPGLEGKILARRRVLGSHWEDVRRAALPLDPAAATVLSVPVAARRCVDVLALPSPEVAELDLEVVDSEGRVVARGEGTGRDRAVVLCSNETQEVTVRLRPRVTSGTAALIVSRAPEGAAAELANPTELHPVTALRPLDAEVSARDAELAAHGLGAGKRLTTGNARAGSALPVALELAAGCTRLDVVAGTPLGPFEASLWDEHGTRLAQASGGAALALFRCGPAARVRLEVMALGAPGPFGVLARVDAAPAAPLLGSPIAAALLLARLDAAAGPVMPSAAQAAERVSVAAGTRAAQPLAIAAGRCVDVVAALGREQSGIELRLRGPMSPDPLASRGEHVTSGRMCAAQDAGADANIEIGIDDGAGEVLMLRHWVDATEGVPVP